MQISPDGRQVYVFGSTGVGIFQRDGESGTLSQRAGRLGCLAEPESDAEGCLAVSGIDAAGPLAFSADGRHAYAAGPVVFDRDPDTGVLTRRPGPRGCYSAFDTVGACTQLDELAVGSEPILSSDGRHLYVLASSAEAGPGGGIAVYARDRASGALSPRPGIRICRPLGEERSCGRGTRRGEALSVAISPDGLSLYVALNEDGLAVIDRDPRTGALGQHLGPAGCLSASGDGGACLRASGLAAVRKVVVSPDGRHVYALSGAPADTVTVLRREPRTGSLRQLGSRRGCISRTGTGGRCAAGGTAFTDASDIALSSDGRSAYVVGAYDGGLTLLDRDPLTGVLTRRRGATGCFAQPPYIPACTAARALNTPTAVTVSPDGAGVYVAAINSDAVAVFERDRAGRRPVDVRPRKRPYRIFGGPSPQTRISPSDELTPSEERAVRRFARLFDQGWIGNDVVATSSARYRELNGCLDVWAGAPESLAVSQLSALYETALASRGAIDRDHRLRRVLGRLRAIPGIQRIPTLRRALERLERQRLRARTIADLTVDTCGLLRQWQADGWQARRPPNDVTRARQLLASSTRGDTRIFAGAARLLAKYGGRHAQSAAERLKPIESRGGTFAHCDEVLNIIDPELVFCE